MHSFIKPQGLWYEINGEWEEWCAGNSNFIKDCDYVYEVALDPGLRLLRIESIGDLTRINMRYGRTLVAGGSVRNVAWDDVARDYDGIEVYPYLWDYEARFGPWLWYYGLDCASGCLWRPRDTRLSLIALPAMLEANVVT